MSPSPDGNGYPFVAAFAAKDRSEQLEIASKNNY